MPAARHVGSVTNTRAIVQFPIDEPSSHPDRLLRDQIEALHGLTPAEAQQRLEHLGHDGKVAVSVVVQFSATCGQNKVCATNRDGGMGLHDDIELLLNPRLEISTPP
jgi:hypothetical protein